MRVSDLPGPGGPAAGGGRRVEVSPERLAAWLRGFEERHGTLSCESDAGRVTIQAADGARAECRVPFPPLRSTTHLRYAGLVEHAAAERTVGVLLARLGGHAAGVFDGPRLTASRVGRRPVHGRAAAGGWSQQRFARRRENQAEAAWAAAANAAVEILIPARATLAGVVLGGDRTSLTAVLADPRLAPLKPLVTGTLLDLPEPRQRVLLDAYPRLRSVWILVTDPP